MGEKRKGNPKYKRVWRTDINKWVYVLRHKKSGRKQRVGSKSKMKLIHKKLTNKGMEGYELFYPENISHKDLMAVKKEYLGYMRMLIKEADGLPMKLYVTGNDVEGYDISYDQRWFDESERERIGKKLEIPYPGLNDKRSMAEIEDLWQKRGEFAVK